MREVIYILYIYTLYILLLYIIYKYMKKINFSANIFFHNPFISEAIFTKPYLSQLTLQKKANWKFCKF